MTVGYVKGKPDVAYWLRQIRLGLEYRKRCAYEDKWPRWRNYYRGLWDPAVMPSNLFFKMVRTTVPRIYFRNPSVSITSQRPGIEFALMAQLMERTDNALLAKMRVKTQIKKMVQDTFMFGTSIGKLGFGSQYQSSPETIGTTQAPLINGKESIEYNINIEPNMPWFLRAPISSYIVESGIDSKDNARWDCYVIRRPIDDIRNDPRLINNKDIGPSLTRVDGRMGNQEIRYPVDSAELYEIRDRKTGKVFIISPTLREKVLLFEPDAFFEMGIDVTNPLVFNDDDENFWGVPDAQILEPDQLELNEIKTMRMYHRRLSVLKILAKRGAISQENIEKLLSPDVGAVAMIDGNVQTDIKYLTGEAIPSDLTEAEMNVMQNVRETLGFSRNEFGEFKPGSHSPTATESTNVKAASEIRVDERRDMVADMLTKVVNDMNPLLFNHWNREQVMEIIGPAGLPLWVAFTPSMLKRGSYEIKVDPDTSVPETKDMRTEKAMLTYKMFKDNPLVDPIQLTQYALRELHGVQFDRMVVPMQGMTQGNPMQFGQAAQFLQQAQQQLPQLGPPQGAK